MQSCEEVYVVIVQIFLRFLGEAASPTLKNICGEVNEVLCGCFFSMRIFWMQLCGWLHISWISGFMHIIALCCEEGDGDLCRNFLTKACDIASRTFVSLEMNSW